MNGLSALKNKPIKQQRPSSSGPTYSFTEIQEGKSLPADYFSGMTQRGDEETMNKQTQNVHP